ncbi:MAG TPA: chemotaxis protein CheW [Longimicrobiales bacterium]|nr:chemotaxis protein CheW [Longimicrobiales bacterium]
MTKAQEAGGAAGGVGREPAAEHMEVLRRRAAELARMPEADGEADGYDVVRFQLAGEEYALAAHSVVRVLTLREMTPLPGAAEPLFGVTQWRGTVLTLLDLRPLLGVSSQGLTDLSKVVVLDGGDRQFGIVADDVSDLAFLSHQDVRPLPGDDGAEGESLLRGITDDGVFIIDTEQLLQRFGRIRRRHHATG